MAPKGLASPQEGFTRIPASPYDSLGDEARMLVHYGQVYDGRLSIDKLEAAFYSLRERWPIIAARLRRDQSVKPNEWYYDVPSEAKLQELQKAACSRPSNIRNFCFIDKPGSVQGSWPFQPASTLPQDRPSIFTMPKDRERELWASNAERSVEDLLRSDDKAIVTMHVTRFNDATLLAICTPHVFCDAAGASEILRAFACFVNGKGDQVKPLERQGEDLFASLSYDKTQPMPPRSNGMQVYSTLQTLRFAFNFVSDLIRRPPSQMEGREVYVPADFLRQLKEQAASDLTSEGDGPDGKPKWVSSSDVLTAWIIKNNYVAHQAEKSPFSVMFPANLRLLPEVEGVGPIPKPYLHNLAMNLTSAEMPVSQVTSLSLGALSYTIRSALQEQTKPLQLQASLRWRLANRGKLQLFFSCNAYWTVCTNWRKMEFLNLSLEAALQPGQEGRTKGKAVRFWSMPSFPTPLRNGNCLFADDEHGGVWVGVLLSKKEWDDPKGWGRYA